jgi:hypothetical protein
MPFLPKSLTLARLTALHARYEFEQGRWKAGWQDVMALLKFARHLEQGPLMIQQLVAYKIENMAIESAAPYLPQMKAVLAGASADLAALPPGPTLSQMILKEKEVAPVWLQAALKKAEKRKEGSWKEVWKEVFDIPLEGEDAGFRHLAKSAKSLEEANKKLKELAGLFDQLARVAALPIKEFDTEYPKFVKKADDYPLSKFFLPGLYNFIPAQRRNVVQRDLFKAAIAVVLGGPDKLKEVKDPFGKGPFEYRALDKGFELKSKLQFKGKPVTLTVGKGNKE